MIRSKVGRFGRGHVLMVRAKHSRKFSEPRFLYSLLHEFVSLGRIKGFCGRGPSEGTGDPT